MLGFGLCSVPWDKSVNNINGNAIQSQVSSSAVSVSVIYFLFYFVDFFVAFSFLKSNKSRKQWSIDFLRSSMFMVFLFTILLMSSMFLLIFLSFGCEDLDGIVLYI